MAKKVSLAPMPGAALPVVREADADMFAVVTAPETIKLASDWTSKTETARGALAKLAVTLHGAGVKAAYCTAPPKEGASNEHAAAYQAVTRLLQLSWGQTAADMLANPGLSGKIVVPLNRAARFDGAVVRKVAKAKLVQRIGADRAGKGGIREALAALEGKTAAGTPRVTKHWVSRLMPVLKSIHNDDDAAGARCAALIVDVLNRSYPGLLRKNGWKDFA